MSRPKKTLNDLRPDWKEVAFEAGNEGKLPSGIVKAIGISYALHLRLLDEEKEYADVFFEAKHLSEAWWDEQGRQNIGNKSFNTALFIWMQKSVFKRRDTHPLSSDEKDELADDLELSKLRARYKNDIEEKPAH